MAAKEKDSHVKPQAAKAPRPPIKPKATSALGRSPKTLAVAGTLGSGPESPEPQGRPGTPMPTCLDQTSGLYHFQHFELSLKYEHARMLRTEKPLGLIVLRFSEARDIDFHNLALFLKCSLRPLDLAARLASDEVAILIPEADKDRAVRLLKVLGQEYAPGGDLEGPTVAFGAALARPYQGDFPNDLVQKARENLGQALEVAQKVISGSSPWIEVDTALAAPERDSLYNGFGSLPLALSLGRKT